MNFSVLGPRLIVRRKELSKESAGGIVLPAVDQQSLAEGEVLGVGTGQYVPETGEYAPIPVDEGATVIFHNRAGTMVTWEGEELLVLAETDLLGVKDA